MFHTKWHHLLYQAGSGASMHTQVRIQINGTERSMQEGTTVSALIQMLALTERKIAVEINREIVPQSQHEKNLLV